jgi:hypothetical protein
MTTPDAPHSITLSSIVVASKDQVASDLAGEVILLSLTTAMYYGLNQVGARVWELVREPARVADVRDVIAREYEVEVQEAERDLLELLRQLAGAGLIEVRDGHPGG